MALLLLFCLQIFYNLLWQPYSRPSFSSGCPKKKANTVLWNSNIQTLALSALPMLFYSCLTLFRLFQYPQCLPPSIWLAKSQVVTSRSPTWWTLSSRARCVCVHVGSNCFKSIFVFICVAQNDKFASGGFAVYRTYNTFYPWTLRRNSTRKQL